MADRSNLTKLLRIFAATIENLDQEQFDQLIAGKAKLGFLPIKRSKESNNMPPAGQAEVLARLNESKNRDEARQILSELATRDALAAFARMLKVHVVKHDRREDIESKIVEFVIGGKLRTEAIQSLNLRGGSGSPSDDR